MVVAIASFIVLLTTEVGARIFYRVLIGEGMNLEGLHETRVRRLDQPDVRKAATAVDVGYRIHPYRAFVRSRDKFGSDPCLWNTEAVLAYGGPVAREPSRDRIVVGLFGGSVAFQLGLPSSGLLKKLQETPAFRGKDVRFVNAAVPSGEMPMQLYTLSYLLLSGYHFDVVVNFGGYNELNPARETRIIYPILWDQLLTSFDDLGAYDLLAKSRLVQLTRQRLAHGLNESLLARNSAVVNLIWTLVDRRLGWQGYTVDQELQRRTAGMDDLRRYTMEGPRNQVAERDRSKLKDEMIRLWLDGSDMMRRLARSRGASYIHILVASPYWPGGKVLSAHERAQAAKKPESEWIPGQWIPDAYRQVLAREKDAVDPTPIFRDVTDTVFEDEVGHLTGRGDDLLADHVVRAIARKVEDVRRGSGP